MKFKIKYTVNGEEDFIIIEGDSLESCQKQAWTEIEKRGASDVWSEEIK